MSTPFIPEDTQWYIRELLEEFQVAGEVENLVRLNTILIKADSPEMAYERAIVLGESANQVYTNTDGVDVTVRLWGLKGVYPVHDRLPKITTRELTESER